ncbi:MAG: DUF433 domain-containing protein [Pirellulaceae bacterium]
MSDNGKLNPTVVRTTRGLTVGGTRLTIYSLIDHFKAGHSDELVREWYRLTPDQLADIHRYILICILEHWIGTTDETPGSAALVFSAADRCGGGLYRRTL